MKFKALVLSALVAFSAMPTQQAEAHGRGRGAAIAAGALILGLGIAAAAADERHYRRHYRQREYYGGNCDRYGCFYYDRYGTEHYRGNRIYREYGHRHRY
jgi:hypothetical protein